MPCSVFSRTAKNADTVQLREHSPFVAAISFLPPFFSPLFFLSSSTPPPQPTLLLLQQ